MIKQLAIAVSSFQKNGKIHGDIKPANIFIKNGNQYILGDLDSSVDFKTDEDGKTITVNKFIASTLPYSAPELLNIDGQMKCTYRLDNWSLGVTLYQAIEQEWPFGDYQNIKKEKKKVISKIVEGKVEEEV